MVTHDIFDAIMISDELIVLDKGKIISKGDVKKVINDENCDWYFQKFRETLKEVSKIF